MNVFGGKTDKSAGADPCCKAGLYGSLATALCCLTPVLVFVLGLAGVAFVTPYLDYFLVPLLAMFLLVDVIRLDARRTIPHAQMISRSLQSSSAPSTDALLCPQRKHIRGHN